MMERLSIGIVLAALGGGESDQRAAAARADPADPEYQTHSVAKIRGPRHRLRNSDLLIPAQAAHHNEMMSPAVTE